LMVKISSQRDINLIVRLIIDNGVNLYEVSQPKKNLETIFMKLAK